MISAFSRRNSNNNILPTAVLLACCCCLIAILPVGADETPNIEVFAESMQESGKGYTACYGYTNNLAHDVTIPVGHDNRFVPGDKDQGQPTIFRPGTHTGVVCVTFKSVQEWRVTGPDDIQSRGRAHKIHGTSTLAPAVTPAPTTPQPTTPQPPAQPTPQPPAQPTPQPPAQPTPQPPAQPTPQPPAQPTPQPPAEPTTPQPPAQPTPQPPAEPTTPKPPAQPTTPQPPGQGGKTVTAVPVTQAATSPAPAAGETKSNAAASTASPGSTLPNERVSAADALDGDSSDKSKLYLFLIVLAVLGVPTVGVMSFMFAREQRRKRRLEEQRDRERAIQSTNHHYDGFEENNFDDVEMQSGDEDDGDFDDDTEQLGVPPEQRRLSNGSSASAGHRAADADAGTTALTMESLFQQRRGSVAGRVGMNPFEARAAECDDYGMDVMSVEDVNSVDQQGDNDDDDQHDMSPLSADRQPKSTRDSWM